jgi:uncharacterized protein (TIGR01777 family)
MMDGPGPHRQPLAGRASLGSARISAVRIAVSGASGLIGSALVPVLEASGHEVVRLVRHEPEDATEIRWDPAAGTVDSVGLAGVDAAIHLSGATIGRRWTEASKREIIDSRVASGSLLARTMAMLDPPPAVLASAGGVDAYGDRGNEILTEDSDLGSGFLAEVSAAWEAAVEPARAAGIRVVTFRQGIVLSDKGGALPRLLTPFKLGIGGRVGNGRQWWSWVSLDDVLRAYVFALGGDVEGIANLTSPNPVTNRQFVTALGRALHRPSVIPLPGAAVRALFGQMGVEALLGSKRVLPARLLAAGFSFEYPELDAALVRALEG